MPARNEAQNLPHVLTRLPAIVSELILVDGHSTDDTVAVARALVP
jgi:glycosyltransferase involved in cell wall biosynthesis